MKLWTRLMESFVKLSLHVAIAALCINFLTFFSGCGGGLQQLPPSLAIITSSLPNGITGTAYNRAIQATGGVGPFTWAVGTGALPHALSLSPSATNTVTISGTPDTGAQGVTFSIKVADSSGQSATQSYTVSILPRTDNLTLAPPNIDFNVQLIGTASAVQAGTLTNTGNSPLAITAIGMTGTNASDFHQHNSTCSPSLAAGADCHVDLSFTPSQLGPRTAALTITDDSVGSPQSVSVNGIGVTSGSNATLPASSLTFGAQAVGTTSTAQSLTLSNYGTAILSITSIAPTANFDETDNCVPSLASGASCTVNVTFTPSVTGSVTGTLTITDDAPGLSQTVSLNGTGTAGKCVLYGRPCSSTVQCCAGLQCVFSGGSSRVGYSCRLQN